MKSPKEVIELAYKLAPNATLKGAAIAIVDIDGTIADNTHRMDKLTGNLVAISRIIAGLESCPQREYVQIVLLTGRGDQALSETREWLTKHRWNLDATPLIMRQGDDHRTATTIKKELFEVLKPEVVFDDDLAIIEMAQSIGILSVLVPSKCVAVAAGKAGAGTNQKK